MAHDIRSGEHQWSHETQVAQVGTSPVTDGHLVWVAAGAQNYRSKPTTLAVRLPNTTESGNPERAWDSNRNVPTCVSPVQYDGRLYTLSVNGVLTCYDATTGRRLRQRRLGGGNYYSSLLVADGNLYASDDQGMTTVLSADAKCEQVAKNDLGEAIHASPAVAGGCLLIRTAGHLFCIKEPDDSSNEVTGPAGETASATSAAGSTY